MILVYVVVVDYHGINFYYLNHPVAELGVTPHSEIMMGDYHLVFKHPCRVQYCSTLPQVIEKSLFLLS